MSSFLYIIIFLSENANNVLTTWLRFRGIGVRIEDDIVITKNPESGTLTAQVLTTVPKTIKDIEELIKNS